MLRLAAIVILMSALPLQNASALFMECEFPPASELPVYVNSSWDPVLGKGQGELIYGNEKIPLKMKMLQSMWWGLGEEVLFTNATFSLLEPGLEHTYGELKAFPVNTEQDKIEFVFRGKTIRASASQACKFR